MEIQLCNPTSLRNEEPSGARLCPLGCSSTQLCPDSTHQHSGITSKPGATGEKVSYLLLRLVLVHARENHPIDLQSVTPRYHFTSLQNYLAFAACSSLQQFLLLQLIL